MKKVDDLSQIKKQREDFINFANFAKSYQSPPKVNDAWELWIEKQEKLELEEKIIKKVNQLTKKIFIDNSNILSEIRDEEITHMFFYSEKQKEKLNRLRIIFPYTYTKSLFKNQEYTEMREIKHGWSYWDDAILIGFGNINDVKIVNK